MTATTLAAPLNWPHALSPTHFLFAALLAAGIIAIIFDRYLEVVTAGTVFIAVWVIVQMTGPNWWVAAILLSIFLTLKYTLEAVATVTDEVDIPVVTIIDELLTDADTNTSDRTRDTED